MKQADKVVEVQPIGQDRSGLVSEVARLDTRIHDECSGYINSTNVLHLSDQCCGKNGVVLGWSLGFDLKDMILVAAMCQAPMAFRGGTDRGKTALAELGSNALFGAHGKHWWRLEISRGIDVDDLTDVDIKRLSEGKLSEAISSSPWLAFPAKLLDEINRAHPKLNNILLHLIDGSGLHVRGNLHIPVGMPYSIDGVTKRYSFTITTANENTEEYAATYAEDAALLRRIVFSINLDDFPPSAYDVAKLLQRRRPKMELPDCEPMTESLLKVYEALPEAVPVSPLGHLFLHYLNGLGTCVRTRSGKLRMPGQPEICAKCHLHKSHKFCGRVGGLTEGLLLWTRDVAKAICLLRVVRVLQSVRRDCLGGHVSQVQKFLDSAKEGEALYAKFRDQYIEDLAVSGEDIVAAYTLIAPHHVFIDKSWLDSQESYEKSEGYAFADVAAKSWAGMQQLLRAHKKLFADLAANGELSPANQSEVETLVTTEDAAMLSIIAALRDEELPLNYREAVAHLGGSPTTFRAA